MSAPSKPAPALARHQFEADVPDVILHHLSRDRGWILAPDYEGLLLYVDMWAFDEGGRRLDDYHVRMDMSYYRDWPPGVTFVNPETRAFDVTKDMQWMPSMGSKPPGTDIGLHPSARFPSGTRQMVCNSMVLEYYQYGHLTAPDHRWDPQRHNLFATLSVLQSILQKPYYGGRGG